MLAFIEITPWHWAGFIVSILFFLAVDLGLFHRHAHVVKMREAAIWTIVWFTLAMLFAWSLVPLRGKKEALQFVTGYLIELSLSMDNVFVIALLFAYFRVPSHLQHRVLYWGILGALVMRGVMIGFRPLSQKSHGAAGLNHAFGVVFDRRLNQLGNAVAQLRRQGGGGAKIQQNQMSLLRYQDVARMRVRVIISVAENHRTPNAQQSRGQGFSVYFPGIQLF